MTLAWCEPCRRYHWHGDAVGHRVAHCARSDAYAESGYVLLPEGPAPAAVLRDARRQEPRGPEAIGRW